MNVECDDGLKRRNLELLIYKISTLPPLKNLTVKRSQTAEKSMSSRGNHTRISEISIPEHLSNKFRVVRKGPTPR